MLNKIADDINANVPGAQAKAQTEVELGDGHVWVNAEKIKEVCQYLKSNADHQYNVLQVISAVDRQEKLEINYMLASFILNTEFILKTDVPRGTEEKLPEINSVVEVWSAAGFQEREAYDMMGIRFVGNPDHRRILCPDDWVGYPLRKDYIVQEKYNDMVVNPPEKVNTKDHFFFKDLLQKFDPKSVSHSWKGDGDEAAEESNA